MVGVALVALHPAGLPRDRAQTLREVLGVCHYYHHVVLLLSSLCVIVLYYVYMHIYIYIYMYTHIYIYIYIFYTEREREIYLFNLLCVFVIYTHTHIRDPWRAARGQGPCTAAASCPGSRRRPEESQHRCFRFGFLVVCVICWVFFVFLFCSSIYPGPCSTCRGRRAGPTWACGSGGRPPCTSRPWASGGSSPWPILYYTLLYSTPLHSTLLYSTLLHSTLLHSTLLNSTPLYSTLLYSTPLYYTLLYYIII